LTGKLLPPTLQIRDETSADFGGVSEVIRRAFGREDEASLVDRLRAQGYVRRSLIAETDGRIVGHVLFSALDIVSPTSTVSALALAPVAVLPEWQRQGIGSQLIERGLEISRNYGHRIVTVLGHPNYYPRFGFSAELAARLDSPFAGKPSFMALELVAGALEGVAGRVLYAPPFGID
jgi:putative acetyltransferase